ncbi:selenocysteine-specific translation elongation factor [Planctomycetota bacterium]
MPMIVGTGGHVDHGKTLLVARLTGSDEDLDRWEEEKKRGLTIDLGFAFMQGEEGEKISFIDVPGHEDFVNNMVVGATGIDIGLLVVAADDSLMPQTIEHLEIMDLLGITDYITAVSKIDVADEEMIELVEEEIQELFSNHPGCTLHKIVRTSATENKGIKELQTFISSLCASLEQKKTDEGYLRLPVDRVFTMQGFGTVVTGSLVSGRIHTGEDVEIMPLGIRARIRGIEVDDASVEEAIRGQRTALNLSGIERTDIARGDQVVFPGSVTPSFMVNGVITSAVSLKEPVENRRDVRFMSGTGFAVARIEILDRKNIKPGDTGCLVQLRFREAMPVKNGDRFILRELSPEITIAGGTILETTSAKLTGSKKKEITRLEKLVTASLPQRIEEYIRKNKHAFSTVKGVAFAENCPREKVVKIIDEEISSSLFRKGERYLHNDTISLYTENVLAALSSFHNSNPYDPGADTNDIMNRLPVYFSTDIADIVLDMEVEKGTVIRENGTFKIKGFTVSLSDEEASCAEKIIEHLTSSKNRYTPPAKEEILSSFSDKNIFENAWRYLRKNGKLIQINREMVFPQESLNNAKEIIVNHFEKEEKLEASEFRDKLNSSRKYTIALLEYFDSIGLTQRIGDVRHLVKRDRTS